MSAPDADVRRRGWLLAALGMLLVSTDSLFIRLSEARAWDMAFLVALFALPIMIGLAWRLDERARPDQLRAHLRPSLPGPDY